MRYERARDGKIRRTARVELEEAPEYGSVEWVLAQPRAAPPDPLDPAPLLLGVVVAVGALALVPH